MKELCLFNNNNVDSVGHQLMGGGMLCMYVISNVDHRYYNYEVLAVGHPLI